MNDMVIGVFLGAVLCLTLQFLIVSYGISQGLVTVKGTIEDTTGENENGNGITGKGNGNAA